MGKPPVRILACDRRACLGDGLLQGLPRACRLGSQERLDLGPALFDRGEIGRIRWEREQPDASGGTRGRHSRDLMDCEIIHDEDVTGPELWQQHPMQKGQQDRAIGEACDRHGRDQPLKTQGAEHGHMAPPMDRLGRLRALAPGRTGVEASHRLMAARFIENDKVVRSERLDGLLTRGPLPLDLWPLVLGGAKRFFCEVGPV